MTSSVPPAVTLALSVDVRSAADPESAILRAAASAPAGARLVVVLGADVVPFQRCADALLPLRSIHLQGADVAALVGSQRRLDAALRRGGGGDD